MPFHRLAFRPVGRPFRTFLKASSGTSSVEYAILVALILGMIVVVVDGVGLMMRSTFERVAATSSPATTGTPHVGVDAPAFQGDRLKLPQLSPDPSVRKRQLAAAVCLLAFGAIVCASLYRRDRRRRRDDVEEQALEELEKEVDRDAIFEKRQEILRRLEADLPAMFEGRLQVGQLMSRHLVTIPSTTPVEEASRLMKEKRLRHLLVCTANGELQGILSIKDLHHGGHRTVGQLMTRDVLTVDPSALLDPTITLLLHNRISCLPVVHEGRLAGILTTSDILMAFQCESHLLRKLAADRRTTAAV